MDLDFASFLRERIREKNISLRRLAEMTGIAMPHIENMLKDEFDELPPAPYLRGYLLRLGRVLEFDPEVWWSHLRAEAYVQVSGAQDSMPRNRFARQPISKYAWAGALGLVILIYLGFRLTSIIGKPVITIIDPETAVATTSQMEILIRGEAKTTDELTLNSEPIPLLSNGSWEKRVVLEPGLNTIEIRAKKFLGGETRIIRQIVFEPVSSPDEEGADSGLELE